MATCARIVLSLLVLALCSLSRQGAAQDAWALLKQPGHIVLLRHANAPGLSEEPPGIDLKNCKLQRNLDDVGRAQARSIGDGFRKRGHTRVRVVSSQFCRALDTGRLMGLGPVVPQPVLNYINFDDLGRIEAVVVATNKLMKTIAPPQLAVLVTHISNIKAVTGVTPKSAEMVVVRFNAAGKLAVAGRIPPP